VGDQPFDVTLEPDERVHAAIIAHRRCERGGC
jgi:hypothetical protein